MMYKCDHTARKYELNVKFIERKMTNIIQWKVNEAIKRCL